MATIAIGHSHASSPALADATSTLQRFILPDEARADRTALYAHWPAGPIRLADGNGLPVAPGATVQFATFFNAFSHRKWRELTGLSTLALRLSGEGRARVTLRSATAGFATQAVAERDVTLGPSPVEIALEDFATLPGEILFAELSAPAAGPGARIAQAEWVTRDAPKRSVRLAAVVTTFRREAAARAAIARFAAEIIPAVPPGELHLFVVDNGQSLGTDAPPGVTILPNRNLGGAGGFTRGLLEARADGRFTHALFMDDDAACEPESVWRTMALLARLSDPRASVAGAMLLAEAPCRQYEKGAVLCCDGAGRSLWKVLGAGTDLAMAAEVAANERGLAPNYGAWWFFAFPIGAVEALPFPFFVRGDDIDFALANDLPVITLNGVATWCDGFAHKLAPATEYLAWRSLVALAFLHGSPGAQRRALLHAGRAALRSCWRFDYAAMHGVLTGIEQALRGPASFADAPAPLDVLARLRELPRGGAPASEAECAAAEPLWRVGLLRWLLGGATLGGHLVRLPGHRSPHARIGWEVGIGHAAFTDVVLLGEGTRVIALRRDRRAFFGGLSRLARLVWRGLATRRRIAADYAAAAPALRTEAYWTEVLARDRDAAAPP